MRELLRRWAELEPERYKDVGNFPQVFIDNAWATVWLNEISVANALVQTAVQEAIEARGWACEQRWYGEAAPSIRKIAIVSQPFKGCPIKKEADTHAEALLSAYLEILQAVGQSEAIA